jgi:eukaryotic-like serine/threonine-protein kinase
MTTHQRNHITGLYHAALERPPGERPAFLDEACAGDAGVRREVESLLRFGPDSGAFLESPAVEIAAGIRALLPGRDFGSYRILGPLGAGGMGEVYRARDRKLGREVAIKLLPPLFTADPERRARFAREARLLATLNHPHIGAIYGLEEIEGQTVLVLELVEGTTLAARLERGPLPTTEALTIARQVTEALGSAHEKHIVHRDLKPANIVLMGAPGSVSGAVRVKVLDFGLATIGAGGPAGDAERISLTDQPTEPGRILGTPAYMSPEQARGLAVDKRTDIWAFGCVLFELLSGKRPFEGSTVTDTLARILEREPDWALLPAETPAPMRRLLARCLRKDPEQRLHDIADARIEIDERDPAEALPPGGPSDGASKGRARRLIWAAALLGLAALAVLLPIAIGSLRPPNGPAEPVTFSIPAPDGTAFGVRGVDFSVSPDGRWLVLVSLTGTRPTLWLHSFATNEDTRIAGTDGANYPFWRPDSRAIGFLSGGKLKTVARDGGIPIDVCDALTGSKSQGGAAWSSDDVIVFTGADGRLHKVAARGGPALPVTTLADGDAHHRWPSFLPDGRHFLYLPDRADSNQLFVGSLDGGPAKPLGRFESNAIYSSGHLISAEAGMLVSRAFSLQTLDVTGEPTPIAPLNRWSPLFSARGAFSVASSGLLVYHVGIPRDLRLMWFDRHGQPLTPIGDVATYLNLDRSPDETRVAVSSVPANSDNIDIWILDLTKGGDKFRITTSARSGENDPAFFPDGRQVAFTSTRLGGFDLFRRPAAVVGDDELLVKARTFITSPSVYGSTILFHDAGGMWTVSVDGDRKPVSLPKTGDTDESGVFSPDGRWIAYSSNLEGRFEIYVRSHPSGDTVFKVSRDGGLQPRWRGDGKEIFFLSPTARLMTVSVDPAKKWSGAPSGLFDTGLPLTNQKTYVVSNDGQRFLMPMPVGSRGVPPITVISNWMAAARKP